MERILLVDTAPLAKRYSQQPGLGSHADLIAACQRLQSAGSIDCYLEMDYSPVVRNKLYRKHFGRRLQHTHNFRGYPILGNLYALEIARGDYFLHFDSDMLMYQSVDFNWIDKGIELLERVPEALCVNPHPGPPRQDGLLQQGERHYELDTRGFYKFWFFTSRRYLINRNRFFSTLPMAPKYLSWKRRLLSKLTRESPLWNWEVMVTEHMCSNGMLRADLCDSGAWTLHAPDHGEEFLAALPNVIPKVESGRFPPEQAGNYDLVLKHWVKTSTSESTGTGQLVAR
ncbi:MAG TPA: hypothetical protein VMJ32_18600 [Pirellulales bacterium]|nr:hypothetical protein [Pirellulales bacterium]